MYSSTLSTTSALDGVGSQHPDRFNSGITRARCTGGRMGPRAGLEGAENLASPDIRFPDRPARNQSL